MSDFKPVQREILQKAFAVAHRGQHSMNINAVGRKHLHAIAKLIWDACGDDGPYKKRLDPDIESVLTIVAQEELS